MKKNLFYNNSINKEKLRKLLSQSDESLDLNFDEYINFINLALGFYFPLRNFCNYKECQKIIYSNLLGDFKWTIPILLSVKKNNFKFVKNSFCKLKFEKRLVGFVKVKNIFKINKNIYNQNVFSTNSIKHPGVLKMNKIKNLFIDGEIFFSKYLFSKDKFFFKPLYKIMKKNFTGSTVFSTRNICHLGHEHIHKQIYKIGTLVVCIIQTDRNKYNIGDIEKTYSLIKNQKHYKKLKIIKIFLPQMHAGPKEAYLQAIVFQNLGFKSFVVGRDHAGIGKFYRKYDSQKIFNNVKNIKIKILKVKEQLLCKYCKKIYFKNGIRESCSKNMTCRGQPIDGFFIKKQIIKKKFNSIKPYLHPKIIDFLKKRKLKSY